MEWLEPTALDAAIKCVWPQHTEAAVDVRGGNSCVAPRSLSFARAVRVVNPRCTADGSAPIDQCLVGTRHQRDDVRESDSGHILKRPRYGAAEASANVGPNAGNIAAENAVVPEKHANQAVAPMRSELTVLLQQQQQQIEAAILRLTPEQVAGLSDEHSTMYWRIKHERHGGQ